MAKSAGVVLAGLSCPPIFSLACICWCIFLLFSNRHPMSRVDQLQYPQLRIQGSLTALFSGPGFMRLVANGDLHMGQSKQFRAHLQSNQLPTSEDTIGNGQGLPTLVLRSSPRSMASRRGSWGSTSTLFPLQCTAGILSADNLHSIEDAPWDRGRSSLAAT